MFLCAAYIAYNHVVDFKVRYRIWYCCKLLEMKPGASHYLALLLSLLCLQLFNINQQCSEMHKL